MSKSYNMAGWRIGFMVGNRELVSALARIKSYHDYGSAAPIQVASIVALEGPQDCVEQSARPIRRRDVMARACTTSAGWSRYRKPRCTSGRGFPSPTRRSARSGSPSACSEARAHRGRARIGFGDYGDDHVRIALIENEHRLRQAVRHPRHVQKDGLLRGAA